MVAKRKDRTPAAALKFIAAITAPGCTGEQYLAARSALRYEHAKDVLRGKDWSGMRWYNTYSQVRTLKVVYFTPEGRSKRALKIRAANEAVHNKLVRLADSVGDTTGFLRSGKIYRFAL